MNQEEIKAEMKQVIRCFHTYSSDERIMRSGSHRLGHAKRGAVGEYYYVHPLIEDRAFSTRTLAAIAGLKLKEQ